MVKLSLVVSHVHRMFFEPSLQTEAVLVVLQSYAQIHVIYQPQFLQNCYSESFNLRKVYLASFCF